MSNPLSYVILNVSPTGALTLATSRVFDTEKEASEQVNGPILQAFDKTHREALHKDLALYAEGKSQSTATLDGLLKKLEEDPEKVIHLTTSNFLIVPVTNMISINFGVNQTDLDRIRTSPEVE